MPSDLVVLRPGQHDVAGELGAVVRDDHARLAATINQRRQFARHSASRDRGVGDRRMAFPGHVIDDIQASFRKDQQPSQSQAALNQASW